MPTTARKRATPANTARSTSGIRRRASDSSIRAHGLNAEERKLGVQLPEGVPDGGREVLRLPAPCPGHQGEEAPESLCVGDVVPCDVLLGGRREIPVLDGLHDADDGVHGILGDGILAGDRSPQHPLADDDAVAPVSVGEPAVDDRAPGASGSSEFRNARPSSTSMPFRTSDPARAPWPESPIRARHRAWSVTGEAQASDSPTCVASHQVLPPGSITPPRRSVSPSFCVGAARARPPFSRADA
jgi:hypothetical protein